MAGKRGPPASSFEKSNCNRSINSKRITCNGNVARGTRFWAGWSAQPERNWAHSQGLLLGVCKAGRTSCGPPRQRHRLPSSLRSSR